MPFLENELKTCPQWLQDGFKDLRKRLPPCDKFAPCCFTCEVWIAFSKLIMALDEEDKK